MNSTHIKKNSIIWIILLLLAIIPVTATPPSCNDVTNANGVLTLEVDREVIGAKKQIPEALRGQQDRHFNDASQHALLGYDDELQIIVTNAVNRANVFCQLANPSTSDRFTPCRADITYDKVVSYCDIKSSLAPPYDAVISTQGRIETFMDVPRGLIVRCEGDITVPNHLSTGRLNVWRESHLGYGRGLFDDYFVALKDFQLKAILPGIIKCIN